VDSTTAYPSSGINPAILPVGNQSTDVSILAEALSNALALLPDPSVITLLNLNQESGDALIPDINL
jgi:hypothetical protein